MGLGASGRRGKKMLEERCGGAGVFLSVPIGSYLSMLMGGDVRGRVNW